PPAAAPPPMAPATASVSAPATAAAAGVLGPLALARKRRASTAGRSALARLPRRARIALLAGEGSLARTLLLPLTLGRGCVLTRGRGPLRGLAGAAPRTDCPGRAAALRGPPSPRRDDCLRLGGCRGHLPGPSRRLPDPPVYRDCHPVCRSRARRPAACAAARPVASVPRIFYPRSGHDSRRRGDGPGCAARSGCFSG